MDRTRIQHSTALPYPAPTWPTTSQDIEEAVLALLLPLLRPVGEHRQHTARPSKGRNRSKCKPRTETNNSMVNETAGIPEIAGQLTVGLTTTYRSLNAQARKLHDADSAAEPAMAVVFVCRKALPDPACASLPFLIVAASSKNQPAEAMRLVPVSEKAEMAIASALGLPRVAMLGLHEAATGTKPLVQYVREKFAPIDIPWLRAGPVPQYFPLKVDTAHIPVVQKAAIKQGSSAK
ncbi:uncharacterized protein HMPREF1541_05783 [Cyphellophora europaea CBS 101466]|uniref:Uncharacterized protein n=1 Tax=Cyphellophora europaea (strain CBS 101466) TaxID=1220924 RepID=W2RSX7_CYPE1|nr:uncharacterized protein HMPREF1541_05783 [Cyphellophora europaea CBS 101466]ETN39557.1 hypothetical protein HMPREF1541_05783 [Cyphellophora europaea CBS 101466]